LDLKEIPHFGQMSTSTIKTKEKAPRAFSINKLSIIDFLQKDDQLS
jgi:hypothetical protein